MRGTSPRLPAQLLDSLNDIYILVMDQERRIIYANAPFLHHFGYGLKDLLGRHCLDLVSPFVAPADADAGLCPEDGCPFYPDRTLYKRVVQGKESIYEGTIYPLAEGVESPFKVMVFREVTKRYNLERQLRRSYELERRLIQASMDGIIANDTEGNILIFNQGASKILGYPPEEAIGKINVARLYPPNQAHLIKELIYQPDYGGVGILENYETVVIHKDGTPVPIWLSARPLTDNGETQGVVGYFRDLRERKRLEEDLLRSERLATLGKMVAHITHEIKTPLLVIGGFARQLERGQDLSPEAQQRLQLIGEEAQRLEKFLSDLGKFTRITLTHKVPGHLPALIQEVAEMMADNFKETGVAFQMQAPDEVPTFSFDSGQIRQVLINLFKNALEAMPQGGLLTVVLQIQGDFLELTITDTGKGISPENLESLFTPFFSTKDGGAGLGLAICRGIIEQHRGEIRIESKVGQGATCLIRLPLGSP